MQFGVLVQVRSFARLTVGCYNIGHAVWGAIGGARAQYWRARVLEVLVCNHPPVASWGLCCCHFFKMGPPPQESGWWT